MGVRVLVKFQRSHGNSSKILSSLPPHHPEKGADSQIAHEPEYKLPPSSRTKNQGAPRGHPGVIRADIPAQNFGQGSKLLEKNKHLGADIHDPKARTSTTLRDFQKLWSEKLWAKFSFPTSVMDLSVFFSSQRRRRHAELGGLDS